MNLVYIIVNEYRHIFSVLVAEFLLVIPAIEKRNKFALRVALCTAICCIICPSYALFFTYLKNYILYISIVWYVFIFAMTGVVIACCFKIKLTSLLWMMASAYAVEHFVYILINEIIFMGLLEYNLFRADNGMIFWLSLLTNMAFCAVTYYIFYKIFKPNIHYFGNRFLNNNLKNVLLSLLFLIIFFVSTLVNQASTRQSSDGFNYLSAVSDLINCLFVLIVQVVGLTTSRISFEKQLSYKLLEDEKKQFEMFKNSVDYVNIKCHDLKHELQRIRQSGSVNTDKLEEIAQGTTLYEAFAKTGNETLDILLTEKNLMCISKGIALTYMADASALSVMNISDIYSLFGNLLDNAIEYVQKLEDEDKRFIRLFVKPQGKMLLIHEENYFDGTVMFVEGFPKTTKDDTVYHGFGVKSMQRTVKKYGGDLKINAEEGIFKVDLFIQIS